MAGQTDPIAPLTLVAIEISKGVNVVLVEHSDSRQQRCRFTHQRADYNRLVAFLQGHSGECRIALEPTVDYHRTVARRLDCEDFEVVLASSIAAPDCVMRWSTLGQERPQGCVGHYGPAQTGHDIAILRPFDH